MTVHSKQGASTSATKAQLPGSYEDVLELLRSAEELEWQAMWLRATARLGHSGSGHRRTELLRVATLVLIGSVGAGALTFISHAGFKYWQGLMAGVAVVSAVLSLFVFEIVRGRRSAEFDLAVFEKEATYRLELAHRLVRPLQEYMDVIADRQVWSTQRREMVYVRLGRFSLKSTSRESDDRL